MRILFATLLLCGLACADDAEAVRQKARGVAKAWGEVWYSIQGKGKRAGWVHFTTVEKDGRLAFNDEWYVRENAEKEFRVNVTAECDIDEFLSPRRIGVRAKGTGDGEWEIEAECAGGRLKVTKNTFSGQAGESEAPPGLVTDLALYRLVTLLPPTSGYDISVFETTRKPRLSRATLAFEKMEPVTVDGKSIPANLFRLDSQDMGKPAYWVAGDGRLLKVQFGAGATLVLSDAKTAQELDTAGDKPAGATERKRGPVIEAKIPVFPGAEGFGTRTPAGRGGRVVEVTSLADHGAGTLREALEVPGGARLVVFRVGGTIELDTPLTVRWPFTTIAGQTAPGGGIALKNAGLEIVAHDVLVRHLRIRPGGEGKGIKPENNDAVAILGPTDDMEGAWNVVLDHCSMSWSEDELFSTWFAAGEVTLSWCVLSEALNRSRHEKRTHSAGPLFGNGSERVTLHHCLLAHNDFRNPLISDCGLADIEENVIYDWGVMGATAMDKRGTAALNFVGNRFIAGPSTPADSFEFVLDVNPRSGLKFPKVWLAGNLGPRRTAKDDDWSLVAVWGKDRAEALAGCRAEKAFECPPVKRLGSDALLDQVLAGAGATLPRRDPVDARIVEEVKNVKGAIVDSAAQAGGWPKLAAGTAPKDSDHDGIPDDWEKKHGFDPADGTDGAKDTNGDGYTNVEEYLNSIR